MFPSRKQWKKWSLPSKLTAVGEYTGIIAFFLTVLFFLVSHNSPSRINTELENNKDVVNQLDDQWIKITDSSQLEYSVGKAVSGYRTHTITPHGEIRGIVSNPKLNVFVFIRQLHRHGMLSSSNDYIASEFWHVSEAVVTANGDWFGSVCIYPHVLTNAPDYDYWELMGVATWERSNFLKRIVPQTCGISNKELMMIDSIVYSETRISMRPPESGGGYYIDHNLAPKPRHICGQVERKTSRHWGSHDQRIMPNKPVHTDRKGAAVLPTRDSCVSYTIVPLSSVCLPFRLVTGDVRFCMLAGRMYCGKLF